ncbi:MAG: hypothetical protein ACK515_23035 [bacterium]|jgi:hypothetical protein|nr:hypothetical protein [Betaproteobacteria bacterium]
MFAVRRLASMNFLLAIGIALVFYGWLIASGLAETDPNVLRANRVPFGAAFLSLVELALLVLYLRRPDLVGLVRVLAAILGVIGLIQTVIIPLLNQLLYGSVFPTPGHMLMWYVYASHLLFALAGTSVSGRPRAQPAEQPS